MFVVWAFADSAFCSSVTGLITDLTDYRYVVLLAKLLTSSNKNPKPKTSLQDMQMISDFLRGSRKVNRVIHICVFGDSETQPLKIKDSYLILISDVIMRKFRFIILNSVKCSRESHMSADLIPQAVFRVQMCCSCGGAELVQNRGSV